MKKLFHNVILSLVIVCGLGFSTAAVAPIAVSAAPKDTVCAAIGGCANNANGAVDVNKVVRLIINIMSAIVGVVAVIMIIVAGFKLMTSQGSPQNVASARSTLIYALVGLVVVVAAQTIVYFVFQKVK